MAKPLAQQNPVEVTFRYTVNNGWGEWKWIGEMEKLPSILSWQQDWKECSWAVQF